MHTSNTSRRHLLLSALAGLTAFPGHGGSTPLNTPSSGPASGRSTDPSSRTSPSSAAGALDLRAGDPPAVPLPAAIGPYALPNTFVHRLPDPASGRRYEVWVDLPPGVSAAQSAMLPSVFVTDAPYAFPMVRALRHRVGQRGKNMLDFVLVGLAGPPDESAVDMRNRDYTPTDPLRRTARRTQHYGGQGYGGGPAYLRYLADIAVPAVSAHYGLDPRRRLILGHSYGALLAAQALLTRTPLFSHYILGSPSYWFDDGVLLEMAAAHVRSHRDLDARVFQYVGADERPGPGARNSRDEDMVADTRRFQAVLARGRFPSLRIHSQVVPGEDHLTVAPSGATRGLLWSLPG